MAKQQKPINTGSIKPNTFDKGLQEDSRGLGLKPNVWTQARNAVPNTTRGDIFELSNEESNKLCALAPYKIIGLIHIDEDKWAVFSTDNTDSEIGLVEENLCKYTTIVNDQCLNFSDLNLIVGVAKENSECGFDLYWDDGRRNPSRTMNTENVPWIQECTTDASGCITCVDTDRLDCDAIRLAPLVKNPCFRVEKGPQGGELLNGSYFVTGAYLVNGQKVTDYSVPSNVQALYDHSGIAGSLEIIIEEMDENFDEFELVVVSFNAQKVLAKRIGVYNTRQQRIAIDIIDDRYPTVNLADIALRNPIIESSDAMFRSGEYLIRTGPVSKFDFNYQPLANQIRAQWVSVEYPADYYEKGGNRTNYLRDEVYPFFIRWVYDTGDKSPSFHIPGRVSTPADLALVFNDDSAIDIAEGLTPYTWRVYNTANGAAASGTTPDGGTIIAKGDMAYWESSELYDDDNPLVWNATYVNPANNVNIGGTTNTDFDLCGKPIRHHKFPDNYTGAAGTFLPANHYNSDGSRIRIMAVEFDNIKPPVDNDGNPIPGIVGYEILRGTRDGNKSIHAKGMINNMRTYLIPGSATNRIGLYPNYPYNPTTGFQATDKFISAIGSTVSRKHFTFHSPETTFKNPFLSAKEIQVYGEMYGRAEGKFEYPDGHPKHKLLQDKVFLLAGIGGIAYALLKKNGKLVTNSTSARNLNTGMTGFGTFAVGGYTNGGGAWNYAAPGFSGGNVSVPIPNAVGGAAIAAGYTATLTAQNTLIQTPGFIATSIVGLGPLAYEATTNTAANVAYAANAVPGTMGPQQEYGFEGGEDRLMPATLTGIFGAFNFIATMSEGADVLIRVIRALNPSHQYALQYQSHCFYNFFKGYQTGSRRREITDQIYLDADLQDFGTQWRINNLYRGNTVALETAADLNFTTTLDNSQVRVFDRQNPTRDSIATTAASHYTALKQRLRNQYGQIEGIIQTPATTCMVPIDEPTSGVVFGGDTYIGRFTEKNTMFFFYNWLNGQPDLSELDYRKYEMIPSPRYSANFEEYSFTDFFNNFFNNILNPSAWGNGLPSASYDLDPDSNPGFFIVKESYFYLFNSGVRDFFVESEVNIDLRDYGEEDSERFFDPYGFTDLDFLFNTGIIKSGNYYKYDYSLSLSRLYTSVTAWGNTHRRDYDPAVAEDCFVYRPDRVIYSLPQNLGNTKDYWKVFLPNNYKDFKSRVSAIKPINKNGSLILFHNESPVLFQGVDTLQTDGGTKLTIGDGGLFSQPLQNVLNTDDSYEYGSCQNRLSVVNTASGVFWMSQNQGKIFQIQNGIKEISAFNTKWWLSTYLPYMLTKDFPDFELTDNPVAGIGCQAIYDNKSQIVYFCKKDYFLRTDILDEVTYVSGDDFLVNGRLPIKLGDPAYFRDASWTISYNPKTNEWIGYHDWHPNLVMPAKNNFLTVKDDGIWRHNDNCQSYCNFYGVDYPFEVEYASLTPNQVNTLRSVEYYMEVYSYNDNCYDRFHHLDFNFDEAIIYNSEQCSGLLKLNLSPKNNPAEIVTYPQINPNSIDILYNKVEQKYRFNQFWDITADRGEFNAAAQRTIFDTEPNGYVRNLNPNNLDYDKFQTERKKFRHYKNTVLLRRTVSGDKNMIVSLANTKLLNSPR